MKRYISDEHGWTLSFGVGKARYEFDVAAYGAALLYYRPDRRLGVSLWTPGWSRYFKLKAKRRT